MAVTETTLPRQAEGQRVASKSTAPGELEEFIGTGDHTALGRMFIGFSLLLLVVGLAIRLLVGIDVAADNSVLGSYVAMVDLSSLVALVFLGVLPALLGLAIVVVPLQVGSPAIAFPRAAALSLWTWLISAGLFVTSIALDGGVGGGDYKASSLGNISLAVMMAALGLGAVCVATTVMTHRPAGMTLQRIPLFAWSMLVASSIWIVTFGAAVAQAILGHVASDSAPGLLEHFDVGLAWLMRGPAIYMLAIPVLGIAGDAVAHATRRPLRNYGAFQGIIAAYGILSFGAWAQGTRSINTLMWALWAVAIALPVLAMFGGIGESLRHGRVKLQAGLLGSVLGLGVLLAGVLVGILTALDAAGPDTLFDFAPELLGRSQAIFVITAAILGVAAAMAHWSPQIWGARTRSRTVNGACLMIAVGGVLIGLVLAVEVFLVANDTNADTVIGIVTALGGLLAVLGVLGALAASMRSARESFEGAGEGPGEDEGLTLEWQVPWPAVGAVRTAELPAEIVSPYPLAPIEEDS